MGRHWRGSIFRFLTTTTTYGGQGRVRSFGPVGDAALVVVGRGGCSRPSLQVDRGAVGFNAPTQMYTQGKKIRFRKPSKEKNKTKLVDGGGGNIHSPEGVLFCSWAPQRSAGGIFWLQSLAAPELLQSFGAAITQLGGADRYSSIGSEDIRVSSMLQSFGAAITRGVFLFSHG